jgi:carbon-monoxide dehydrogenase small subunit
MSATTTPEPLVPITLTINGDEQQVAVRASQTLLEVLRYDLDLVGTKQGCDKGDCGACTVLLEGAPVLACLTLAVACRGKTVTTVESLAGAPNPDPLLKAFDCHGAGQCGFCTPGMLMTAKGLLAKHAHPSKDTIRQAISGNLCRCTGYGPIVEAIASVGQRVATDTEERLPPPLPSYGAPKP